MNTLKKTILIILTIAFILSFNTIVYGFDLLTNTSNDSIKIGDEVTYTIKFDQPILTADFILSYDSSKLEYIESITQNVEYTNYENNNYIQFLYADESGFGTDTIELIFKAKELTSATSIKFNNLNVHSKDGSVSYSIENVDKINDATVQQISIVEDTKGNNNNQDKNNTIDEPSNNPNAIPNNINNSSSSLSNQHMTDTTFKGILPYTGIGFNILIIVFALIIVVILIKNRNKLKQILPIFIFIAIFTIVGKSDANDDMLIQSYKKINGFENIIVMMPNLENRNITYEEFLGKTTSAPNITEAKNFKGENLENTQLIGTGTKLSLNNGAEYQVIVYGDVNGDGKVNSNDIAEIIENNLNIKELTGIFKKASNLSNISDEDDNLINSDDIRRIKDFILNRLENNLVDEFPKELEDNMPGEVSVKSISIKTNPNKTSYIKGEGLDLTGGSLSVTYEDGSSSTIDMTSSDVSVTGFDSSSTGNKTITVSYGNQTATFTVTVKNEITVKLDKTNIQLNAGESTTLSIIITPSDVQEASYERIIENASVVNVEKTDQFGILNVTGLAKGTTTITFTVTVEGTEFILTCNVTVNAPDIPVTGITLDSNEKTLVVGDTGTLKATIAPDNATNREFQWSTSNSSILKIVSAQNGTLTFEAASAGTATITATTKDGNYTASCTVTVTEQTSTSTPFHVIEEGKIVDKNGNEILLSGVNLGGWMLQEYWMCPVYNGVWDSQWANLETLNTLTSRGFTDAQISELYNTYQSNWITDYDFQKMSEIGINCVRVPFWYRNFMKNPEGEWINSDFSQNPGFQRLDWIISECKKYNIYVIFDLHGAPGGQGSGHCDGSKTSTVFTNETHRAACIKLWEALANRYKDEEIVALYDILNEPNAAGTDSSVTTDRRNILYDELYKAIRSIDSKHIICIEGIWTYDKLPNPEDIGWENVSYSVHYYTNDKIPDFVEYCKNHNIAPNAGEYQGASQLETLISNGVHSTIWTWKRMGGGDSANDWGLFVDADGSWADVTTESYESIKNKWGTCIQTKNSFTENTNYTNIFKNLLKNN